ncbi:MAG: hypothetical protein ABI634_18030 [Acidobacteriota bacterium]
MRRMRMLLLPACVALGLVSTPQPAAAQTAFVPYFGQIPPHYDRFDWHIYKTDHFEIYYYPSLEPHLERVASYAESAYQHISADLKHDLATRVPLIVFKTSSEFQENNVFGGETPEGVLAFAEPERNRMLLPIDEPPDQLYRLITHELTHIFEFDIIPRGLISSALPLWVDEGLANYMAGYWNILDLMQVRDAALTDNIPKMSHFESEPLTGRLPYSLGHATFEFIESRWGKEGLRQFLFSLRKNVLGSGETAYEEALKLKPEEFDEQFDRYIKERFKPFRDKERPADYGRNLAPSPEKTPYVAVLSLEPSPSGDILAAVVGNRRDQEYDIILVSAKDGQFIRNLTKGFDKDRGFENIEQAGGLRGNLVPWIAWAPVGDRLGYFVRTEKDKTLIIQNVVSGKTEKRIKLTAVNNPESPAFSADGKSVAFAAIQGGVTDIYAVDLESGAIRNLTKDATADYAPTFSPDGRTLVYTARVGGSDKLFQMDLATGTKTQITFGSHDDTAAKYYDDHTLVFTSTATDPSVNVPLEVAKNANIPNVWTLDLRTKVLKQWTDAATGNVSPVVLHQSGALKVAFVSYYKGENGIHAITGDKPVATVASEDFGGPGPVFDFTAPISHSLVRDNIHRKGAFEKMTLAGRPPLNLGVTNSGTIYGNTQITFADVLGDKQISFYAQSVQQYRTTAFTYVNSERRLQYALQGFSQDLFYYGQNQGALYDPTLAPYVTRDLAESVQTQRGGTGYVIYPLSRHSRVEAYTGYIFLNESYTNDALQQLALQYQQAQFGQSVLRNGNMVPFGLSFYNETTLYREYGPVAGRALKLGYDGSPAIGTSWIARNTLDVDSRYYKRLAANGVFALRFRGLKSWGRNPDFMYYGGNSEMRGYEYLEFIGNKGFFANAELRFPLIEAMLTPVGVLGGLRGVFFGNLGATGFNGQPFKVASRNSEVAAPLAGYDIDDQGNLTPRFGSPFVLDGLRLVDGRASYGFGLESFLLGFPMHFDWSWKTLFNKTYEDLLFPKCTQTSATNADCTADGASFRKVKFDFWIGYDF